ncbi:type IV toxin-antitoxin system AbiEi family antitoxin domain-containing protein [Jiangella mangrovi]|uniref:Putative transcriptional regulator of viral defense system n=1 Tax=Jiangella mangrovi TaxID=1524084 RepID=A0A7W9LNI7_9ACTN|nr:type IV toxin-antitoxin system AbiEi family antitoxin domain-containing protein [Jiangella mangrovi]MBB5790182.1 putative transcriptional regulator of viral defense system [Jiangella mangrovi]
MSDIDHDRIYQQAEAQAGYFTVAQAAEAGMDPSTLRYHARPGGRYARARRGLYRLRHFPTSPTEHIVAAWLPLQGAEAVVSHASALELYELSDLIPDAVHVSVPRAKRGQRPRPGVRIHTQTQPFGAGEVRMVAGVTATSPERSIVDTLDDGGQPDQVEQAITAALRRGIATRRRLRAAAEHRSSQVRSFVADAMAREAS